MKRPACAFKSRHDRPVGPYGQIIGPAVGPSRRLTMIVAQEPTQSLAALHRPLALTIRRQRKQQDVALPLEHWKPGSNALHFQGTDRNKIAWPLGRHMTGWLLRFRSAYSVSLSSVISSM